MSSVLSIHVCKFLLSSEEGSVVQRILLLSAPSTVEALSTDIICIITAYLVPLLS